MAEERSGTGLYATMIALVSVVAIVGLIVLITNGSPKYVPVMNNQPTPLIVPQNTLSDDFDIVEEGNIAGDAARGCYKKCTYYWSNSTNSTRRNCYWVCSRH